MSGTPGSARAKQTDSKQVEFYMVAKNNAGAQANLSSSDPLAYASSSDTRGDTPLQHGSRECNEVTAHPNELWEPSDELNDVSSPDQAF